MSVQLHEGDLLSDRFRVDEFLGEGGISKDIRTTSPTTTCGSSGTALHGRKAFSKRSTRRGGIPT